MEPLTQDQLISLLTETFEIQDSLNSDTDLSNYIKDSIDLGELLAVLKERYGVVVDPGKFINVYKLSEALSTINESVNEQS